jgi:diguanylate cyclase
MLATPLRVAGRVINTSVSIGVTLCPQDACDLDSALRNADLAMYKAKESGRSNVQFFQPEMNTRVRPAHGSARLETSIEEQAIHRSLSLADCHRESPDRRSRGARAVGASSTQLGTPEQVHSDC